MERQEGKELSVAAGEGRPFCLLTKRMSKKMKQGGVNEATRLLLRLARGKENKCPYKWSPERRKRGTGGERKREI